MKIFETFFGKKNEDTEELRVARKMAEQNCWQAALWWSAKALEISPESKRLKELFSKAIAHTLLAIVNIYNRTNKQSLTAEQLLKRRNMNPDEAKFVASYMIDLFYNGSMQQGYDSFVKKFNDTQTNVNITKDDLNNAKTFALRLWDEKLQNQNEIPSLKSLLDAKEESYLKASISSQRKALITLLQNNILEEWPDTCMQLYNIYKEFQETEELANTYKIMASTEPLKKIEFINHRTKSEETTAKSIATTIYMSKVLYEPNI